MKYGVTDKSWLAAYTVIFGIVAVAAIILYLIITTSPSLSGGDNVFEWTQSPPFIELEQ